MHGSVSGRGEGLFGRRAVALLLIGVVRAIGVGVGIFVVVVARGVEVRDGVCLRRSFALE